MKKEEFHAHLKPGYTSSDDLEALSELAEIHPYSSTVQMVYAKALHAHNSIHYEQQLQNAALVASDRRKLYQLIMAPVLPEEQTTVAELLDEATVKIEETAPQPAEVPVAEKEENKVTRPEDAVDEMILAEAVNSSIQKELQELESTDLAEIVEEIISPISDTPKAEEQKQPQPELPSKLTFSSWLNVSDSPPDNTRKEIGALVDQFISKKDATKDQKTFFSAAKMAANSLIDKEEIVTETLAKIYEDQGNYEKAISAYKTLSLRFPEKSTFFASRIKELRAKQSP